MTIAASAASWMGWIDFILLKISYSFDAFSDPPWISVKLHGNVNGSIAGFVSSHDTIELSRNFLDPIIDNRIQFPCKKKDKNISWRRHIVLWNWKEKSYVHYVHCEWYYFLLTCWSSEQLMIWVVIFSWTLKWLQNAV